MKHVLFALALLYTMTGMGQYDPLHPPSTFQSKDNPLYWKNRKPYEGYWQQDVEYHIKATLDDQSERITGTLRLEYTNNSPVVLNELYFHLYQNAFEPGSYMGMSELEGDTVGVYQHTEVNDLRVNQVVHAFEKDNTILRVPLSNPVRSGETVTITCNFVTQFGPEHGRMKVYAAHGYKHFNVVHWYPRVSVFDRKFGWTTDQHLGNEFYGDFGSFDVELSLPEHYILDATGNLLNRNEVLPPALMEKLEIGNFAGKPWNDPPSEVIAPSAKLKTWKFHAENVHDFAWTADPTYRIGTAVARLDNGREVMCIALAQEQHASGWQNAAAYTARIIELYSRDFGEYAYHKMIVADARDGMEYPMLTLDSGRDPHYRSLLIHEVGHNWFYGMVGNNETYRAALDEGFTQFMTGWAMTALEGDTATPYPSKGVWRKWLDEPPMLNRDGHVYNGYYYSAVVRDTDPQLNTHSDQFEDRYQYGQVYYKTAVMLYNLQYVLGDSLFIEAMRHYFHQWKFCHPYFEDFRSSIIQFTGVDLNWFFDQWLETDKKIDYAICAFRKKGEQTYELRLSRKGGMQMPLDVTLYDKDGKEYLYHIPNTRFVKNTDARVLPQWYGWGDMNPQYTAIIELDADIRKVKIDPSRRLADVYQLNNTRPFEISLELDNLMRWGAGTRYKVEWHPSIWYNGYDGIKAGIEVSGSYSNFYHKFDAGLWFSSGVAQQRSLLEDSTLSDQFNRFSYRIHYTTPLRGIGRSLSLVIGSRWLDGLAWNTIGWLKKFPNDKTQFGLSLNSLFRPSLADLNYLIYPDAWNADSWNNFSEATLQHKYQYGNSEGRITSQVRSPFFWSDYNYGFVNLEAINDNRFAGMNIRTRTFAQYGLGDLWAPESRLYAAGGNPEKMMSDPFVRSIGFIPSDLYGYSSATGSFQVGGGLNLRGYNNYVLPELNGDSLLRFAYAGSSGAALNTEIEFDDLIPIRSRTKPYVELKTYLFADAGIININGGTEPLEWSNIRVDAGLGAALEVKQWGMLDDLRPLTIRADFPLFLNRPPVSEEYLQFRWLIALERAF